MKVHKNKSKFFAIIPITIALFISFLVFRVISEEVERTIAYKQRLSTGFILSYAQFGRAFILFKEICGRYPTKSEGLEVLTRTKIKDCPQFKYSAPLLGKDNLSYLRKSPQKLWYIVHKERGAFLHWSGEDLVFNTEDDTYKLIRPTYFRGEPSKMNFD